MRIMGFLGSAVIVIAMAVVSACLGALGFLLLRFDLNASAVLALAGFGVLIVFQFANWRGQDRRATSRGFEDLSRSIERFTREIAVLGNRVAALETAGAATAARDVAAIKLDLGRFQDEVTRVTATLAEQSERVAALTRAPAATPAPGPEAAPATDEKERKGRFAALSRADLTGLVASAIEGGRIEVLLQPIVTLPQRKIRWYEVVYHLKTERGEAMLADDFAGLVEESGLAARLDSLVLLRTVQLVRRLQARNREAGLVVNIVPASLADGEHFREIVDFFAANAAIAASVVLELPQAAFKRFGPIEFEAMAAIAQHGFKFSLDQVRDLRLDTRELADRGFRFVKVAADVLLGKAGTLPVDIHPIDLADLLARYGIDLVADRIETEATVVDLLDHDVRFGQGHLFSPPRPVRADILGELAAVPGTAAAPAATTPSPLAAPPSPAGRDMPERQPLPPLRAERRVVG